MTIEWKTLHYIVSKSPKWALGKMFCQLLYSLIPALTILTTQKVVNHLLLLIDGAPQKLPIYSLLLIGLTFLSSIRFSIDRFLDCELEMKINKALSRGMVTRLANMPYQNLENEDFMNQITQIGMKAHKTAVDYFNGILCLTSNVLANAALVVIFMKISHLFGFLYIFFIVFLVFCNVKMTNELNQMYDVQTSEERKLSYLSSLLSEKNSLAELRVFDALKYIKELWRKSNKKVLQDRLIGTLNAQKFKGVSYLLYTIWIGLFMGFLLENLREQKIDFGLFLALFSSIGSTFVFTKAISDTILSNAKNRFKTMLLFDFLEKQEPVEKMHRQDALALGNATIEFRRVSFRYLGTNQNILENISFCIQSDENVAIVGGNGSGKSTMIKLLCRLYKPTEGQILINGCDIWEIPLDLFREYISAVFQDYGKYQFTLREAIGLGNVEAMGEDKTVEKVLRNLTKDDCFEFGLDQSLGKLAEDGIGLSGGQWQNLAIARACLAASKFTVLDEPTASLDPFAESRVYRNFLDVSKNKGTIIISHRLVSARIADRIIVLANRSINDIGCHGDLMDRNGLYAKMFASQQSWYA